MILRALLKTLLLPPAFQLLGIIVAWLLWQRWPRLSRWLMGFSVFSLVLLSTPIVSSSLMATLKDQNQPLTSEQGKRAEVIVILGGGRVNKSLEYGGDAVNDRTLMRLRYGAKLQRELHLPILVTGGSVFDQATVPEAVMMAGVLQDEFGIPVRWQEGRSQTTAENAAFTAEMLKQEGVKRILLVTHSWHMPRAVGVFTKAGLLVVPAPMDLAAGEETRVLDFIPSPQALLASYFTFHEWLGYWVYRVQGLI